MTTTRRTFLQGMTYAGAGLIVAGFPGAEVLWAESGDSSLSQYLRPYLTGMRMAATPATAYRAYRSKPVSDPQTTTWVQLDLGASRPMDAIQLFPASERMYPGRDQYYGGEGFPLRFRIDACDDPEFRASQVIADFTQTDFPDPQDNITQYAARGVRARYLRITATRLRPVKQEPSAGETAPSDSPEYTLTMAKVSVLSGGRDVAVGAKVSADTEYGNPELLQQLTRPPRQDGEAIHVDHPASVTGESGWRRIRFKAEAPKGGVTLGGGVFQTAMENNIQYLLNSYTTDELLRQFYERAGKITNFKPVGSQIFWEEDLAGSNAGRFLMGAGNSVRWIENAELRQRMDAVVDGIQECAQPDGYIMAYPEDTIFYSERAAYTRAWLTHGLLEAAYAGNPKPLPMLRGYYDWFNRQAFLPEMLRGAIQGGQGMIANTRVGLSPVGKASDIQVIQRYYQEDGWLAGLARREKEQIWQYPYDRPHCYLLTNLEAYLDLYLATGDSRYYDAVLGAWELYHAHWEQPGGSISIIEFEKDPPDSNYLRQKLGELCGSSFWVFLSQRFHLLNPDEERYATEIEKSIYNVAMANQDGSKGLRYHTILEGTKEQSTHENTCCEGQGTRLLGSLPEHIYSIAPDGLYVNLYEPSTVRWEQNRQSWALAVQTRFPFDTKVHATVKTAAPGRANIRIRIPSWADREMKVSVNGKTVASGRPGTYLPLDRVWSEGDTIAFSLPAAVQIKRYEGADQIEGKTRYSFEYGPILLAAVGSAKVDIGIKRGSSPEELSHQLRPDDSGLIRFDVPGNPECKLVPYWQIADEEFTCLPTITEKI